MGIVGLKQRRQLCHCTCKPSSSFSSQTSTSTCTMRSATRFLSSGKFIDITIGFTTHRPLQLSRTNTWINLYERGPWLSSLLLPQSIWISSSSSSRLCSMDMGCICTGVTSLRFYQRTIPSLTQRITIMFIMQSQRRTGIVPSPLQHNELVLTVTVTLTFCRAIYTGFFFKLWDNVFNTLNPTPCQCYSCRPTRSREEWEKVKKPDYSVLLSVQWWLSTDSNTLGGSPSLKDE